MSFVGRAADRLSQERTTIELNSNQNGHVPGAHDLFQQAQTAQTIYVGQLDQRLDQTIRVVQKRLNDIALNQRLKL